MPERNNPYLNNWINSVRTDMDVNENERISNITHIKVKEQCFSCCSILDSHSRVFYMQRIQPIAKTSVKRPLACSRAIFFASADLHFIRASYVLDAIWWISFYLPEAGLSKMKYNTDEVNFRITSSLFRFH